MEDMLGEGGTGRVRRMRDWKKVNISWNNVSSSFKYSEICTVLGTYRMHIVSHWTKALGDPDTYEGYYNYIPT